MSAKFEVYKTMQLGTVLFSDAEKLIEQKLKESGIYTVHELMTSFQDEQKKLAIQEELSRMA